MCLCCVMQRNAGLVYIFYEYVTKVISFATQTKTTNDLLMSLFRAFSRNRASQWKPVDGTLLNVRQNRGGSRVFLVVLHRRSHVSVLTYIVKRQKRQFKTKAKGVNTICCCVTDRLMRFCEPRQKIQKYRVFDTQTYPFLSFLFFLLFYSVNHSISNCL